MLLVVTAVDIAGFRAGVDGLSVLAFRDAKAALGEVADVNPFVVRDRLLEVVPELVNPYVGASSELAATFYEQMRADAVGGQFYASTVDDLSPGRIDSLVRYAVSPLFDQSLASSLSLLAGGMQRIIANSARNTIQENVLRDPVRVGYARFPASGCCAFCALLAGRGAVYNSEASAGGVVGRGVDASATAGKRGGQGRGVKTRGSREIGKDFHDFCKCSIAPVFAGDQHAIDTRIQYEALYPGLGPGGTVKTALAQMREDSGLR